MDDEDGETRMRVREQLEKMQKDREMDERFKAALKSFLEPEAYERMMNVKISSPEKYTQLTMLIAKLHQTGQIRGKISDEQLVQILTKTTPQRDTKIEIKRK